MERIGRRYRTGRADASYDVIVIGSGIGGLANAALLSKLGRKVCVLEQHYTAGGFTHSYERNGYEWDVGVHYIGEMQRAKSPLRRIFDVITEGQLKWAPMDPVYDRIIIGERPGDPAARGPPLQHLAAPLACPERDPDDRARGAGIADAEPGTHRRAHRPVR